MMAKGFDILITEGSKLLNEREAVYAHKRFGYWLEHVTKWLNDNYPDTGFSAKWMSLGFSLLVTSGGYSDDVDTWIHFKSVVQIRMKWLGDLTSEVIKFQATQPSTIQGQAQAAGRKEIKLQLTSRAYVDPNRIDNLSKIANDRFDLSKLILLCEELNICFAAECYLAMTMLTRSILDHIPPIFGFNSFKELSNNYGIGGRSFKEQMQNLESSSRKISDSYLHMPIRVSETLPTITQVDFSNNLDTLLAEIIRILKSNEKNDSA